MEDEIIEIIKQEGPIYQGKLINQVLTVENCSECGKPKKSEDFEEREVEVLKVLHRLMDRNDAGYMIDWKIEWVGE